jgi:hypothetical protein
MMSFLAICGWVTPLVSTNSPVRENQLNVLVLTPSATPSPTPLSIPTGFSFLDPTFTPTPVPGGRIIHIEPDQQKLGWVVSDDKTPFVGDDPHNHFGDNYLYVGTRGGQTYLSGIQFDLADIPRGTTIYAASLRLVGLRDDLLAKSGDGTWQVQILATDIDYNWETHDYKQISKAPVWDNLGPPLTQEQLGKDKINLFEFTPAQLALLERRLIEGSDESGKQVSFRLIGPQHGEDSLFSYAFAAIFGDSGGSNDYAYARRSSGG